MCICPFITEIVLKIATAIWGNTRSRMACNISSKIIMIEPKASAGPSMRPIEAVASSNRLRCVWGVSTYLPPLLLLPFLGLEEKEGNRKKKFEGLEFWARPLDNGRSGTSSGKWGCIWHACKEVLTVRCLCAICGWEMWMAVGQHWWGGRGTEMVSMKQVLPGPAAGSLEISFLSMNYIVFPFVQRNNFTLFNSANVLPVF